MSKKYWVIGNWRILIWNWRWVLKAGKWPEPFQFWYLDIGLLEVRKY